MALANRLETKLVTMEKKPLRAFPKATMAFAERNV